LRIGVFRNPTYIGIKVDLFIVLGKNGSRQEEKYRGICNYARKKFHHEFSLCFVMTLQGPKNSSRWRKPEPGINAGRGELR
jgi:hypothetical protein